MCSTMTDAASLCLLAAALWVLIAPSLRTHRALVEQSQFVVSRTWDGSLSFRPRRARNGHAVFSFLPSNS
jgi:hypothetical protein